MSSSCYGIFRILFWKEKARRAVNRTEAGSAESREATSGSLPWCWRHTCNPTQTNTQWKSPIMLQMWRLFAEFVKCPVQPVFLGNNPSNHITSTHVHLHAGPFKALKEFKAQANEIYRMLYNLRSMYIIMWLGLTLDQTLYVIEWRAGSIKQLVDLILLWPFERRTYSCRLKGTPSTSKRSISKSTPMVAL